MEFNIHFVLNRLLIPSPHKSIENRYRSIELMSNPRQTVQDGTTFTRRLFCLVIAGIDMTEQPHRRIGRQYALKPSRGLFRPVGDNDLTRMQRISDTDATAVMKTHPRGAACGVH